MLAIAFRFSIDTNNVAWHLGIKKSTWYRLIVFKERISIKGFYLAQIGRISYQLLAGSIGFNVAHQVLKAGGCTVIDFVV